MTDRELAAQAEASLRRTTVSYPEWQRRVAAGKYTPKDGSATEWGKAFAALAQIGITEPPPPPPTGGPAPPIGPFVQRTGALFLRNADDVTTERIHVTSSPDYG